MASALHTALVDELASLERVLALLRQEQECLARARIDDLADLTENKIRALAELEQQNASRQALMTANGIPDDGSAISDWLGQHDSAALETWQTLLDLAKQAALLNRSNGQLIASREEANRTLMGILISRHEAETSYTADGHLSHTTIPPRRRLDQA